MFTCAVTRADKLTVGEVELSEYSMLPDKIVGRSAIWSDEITAYLRRFFSEKQLQKIETAFEGDADFHGGRAAANFNDNVSDPAKRLARIMRNIIDNGGEFRP